MSSPVVRRLALLSTVHFLHNLAHCSYLHLPGFLDRLGARTSTIGPIMATLTLSAVLFRPLIGRVLDTQDRRLVAVAASACNVVVCLLYLTVSKVGPWIYCVRFAHGIVWAAVLSALFTMAADLIPAERRIQGIGLFGVAGMLPLSVAGLVGDALLARGSYGVLFCFAAAAAASATLVVAMLPESRGERRAADPDRPWLRVVMAASLRPVWLIGMAMAVSVSSYLTFIKSFVLARGIGSVGAFFTAYTIAAVTARTVFGRLPDRLGTNRALPISVLSLAAGLLLLAASQSTAWVMVAGVFCGIGQGYAFPTAMALVVDRAHPSERGSAMAAFTALFDLGVFTGSIALGALLSRTSYSTMYACAAAIALLGAATFARSVAGTWQSEGVGPMPPAGAPERRW